ncbi:MAG: TrkH family potassium uptake protein [Candidatus Thermoplasmatota archaeon]
MDFERKHAIGLVVLAWPLVSLPSALPFYLTGTAPTYLDAFFEAISGWTTTGLTTIGGNADLFLHSINFWRHLMQFIGGFGIIAMGIIVLVPLSNWENTADLAVAAGRKYRIVPSLSNTIKIIAVMYMGLLGLSTALFYISGLGWFHSLNHAMAGLSTGGFSTRGGSLGAFGSNWAEIVALPIMILGSTNFVLVYYLLSANWKNYLKDIETKVFWGFLLSFIGILLIWFAVRSVSYSHPLEIIFMIVSALTTTGWNNVPASAVFLQWAPLALIFVILSMIIGANSSSTGGGLKAFRVALIIKSIIWRTEATIMPDSIVQSKKYRHIEDKYIDEEELTHVFTLISMYLIVLFFSFLIFTIFGHPILRSFYEVSSAVGTVGLSSGLTNLGLHPFLKILLCFNMWLGRIEILPILYFIRYARNSYVST